MNFGIEAGDNEVLKTYAKGIAVEMAKSAIEYGSKAGIETMGYFLLGAPYESKAQCLKTVRLACQLPLDYCQFTLLVPFPGTKTYEAALADESFGGDYLKEWATDPNGPAELRLWHTLLSETSLERILRLG